MISIAYSLVLKVGFYSLECKEWWSKSTDDKTRKIFKVHFYREFKENVNKVKTLGYKVMHQTWKPTKLQSRTCPH